MRTAFPISTRRSLLLAGTAARRRSPARRPLRAGAAARPWRQARTGRELRSPGHGRRRLRGRPDLRQLPALDGGFAGLGRRGEGRTRRCPIRTQSWNAWRNAKKDEITPDDHWVCVQSVVAHSGSLWVLDAAAPALEKIVKGGPKLVQIDLATNKVVRTYPFSEQVAPRGHLSQRHPLQPRGRWGYLTDSGRGAILVVDLGIRRDPAHAGRRLVRRRPRRAWW